MSWVHLESLQRNTRGLFGKRTLRREAWRKEEPTTDLVAVNSLHVLLCLCNTVRAVVKRRDAHWNKTSDCLPSAGGGDDDDGLTQQQRRICRRTLDLMPAVVIAGQQTMQVCQTLFYDSRWNCSSVLRAPQFTADLTQGTITLFQFIPYTGPHTRYHTPFFSSSHTQDLTQGTINAFLLRFIPSTAHNHLHGERSGNQFMLQSIVFVTASDTLSLPHPFVIYELWIGGNSVPRIVVIRAFG